MLIFKESLKTSFTIEQLLTHKFFGEFATQKSIDAIHDSLRKEISIAEISGKNSINNAIQKFETRLKDEQKLVCKFVFVNSNVLISCLLQLGEEPEKGCKSTGNDDERGKEAD